MSRPLPTIRGKQIDGVLYVRAEDVADALNVCGQGERLVLKLYSFASKGRKA